tara:strand:+ start:10044 stop:10202 length:159 start_codon:yes stop_codon:yes gene_type:complete
MQIINQLENNQWIAIKDKDSIVDFIKKFDKQDKSGVQFLLNGKIISQDKREE